MAVFQLGGQFLTERLFGLQRRFHPRQQILVDFQAALAEAFLVLQDDAGGRRVLERLGAQRFIVTTDADYEPVYRYAREAGLDLATYDYVND